VIICAQRTAHQLGLCCGAGFGPHAPQRLSTLRET
jgi:hypothetical protein